MQKLSQSWVDLNHATLRKAPHIWQDWLSNIGSLTQLIANRTKSSVSVEVLKDRNQEVLMDESLLFKKALFHCRVREIYLCVDGTPVVAARSILPTSSSTGINREILQLGTKPLGETLFKSGKAPILRRQITYIPDLGWGRRTLYKLRGHPILISEVFLPELLEKIKS
jgi:chorismate--pyruvate lyase